MLIVGKVCNLGVGGVFHKSAFKPLNELALEVTNVSVIRQTYTEVSVRSKEVETDLFGSCAGIVSTPHLGNPYLWDTMSLRELDHSSSLLVQHGTILCYRQLTAAIPVHAYSLECILWAVRCRQREELGHPLVPSRIGDTVDCAKRHGSVADAWRGDQGVLGGLVLRNVVLGRDISLWKLSTMLACN